MKHTMLMVVLAALAGCGGVGVNDSEMTVCTATASLDVEAPGSGIQYPFTFTQNMYRFPDGSAMTTCEVLGPQAGSSWFVLFRKDQEFSDKMLCGVVYDHDGNTPAGGQWWFTAEGGTTRATYNSPGAAQHGLSIPLSCQRL